MQISDIYGKNLVVKNTATITRANKDSLSVGKWSQWKQIPKDLKCKKNFLKVTMKLRKRMYIKSGL